MYRCKYFKAIELVSPSVYKIHGDAAIKCISTDILIFLDTLREDLKVPILVNRPKVGITQRGLKTTLDEIVKDNVKRNRLYLSAHILGRAVDFEVPGKDMKEISSLIINNPERYNTITRMENPNITLKKGYIHVDNIATGKKGIYVFNP